MIYKLRKKNRNNIGDNIILILSVANIIYIISGFTGEFKNYLSLLMVLAWCFFAFIMKPKAFSRMMNTRVMLIFLWYIIFYFFMVLISSGLINSIKYTGVGLTSFWPLFLFIYYYKDENYTGMIILIKIASVFWILTSLRSIGFYIENPSAARLLAADANYYGAKLFLGGYGLAFGSAILNTYLFDLIVNRVIRKKSSRFFFGILIAVMCFLIIKTESVITIIVNFLGILLVVFLRILKKKKFSRRILIVFLFLLLFVIFLFQIESIGKWIIHITSTSEYNVILSRFNEIGYKMVYGSNSTNSSDMNQRLGNIVDSFLLFLKSPIIGNGYKYGFIFIKGKELGIGAHCEWIDILAELGIMGGLPFLMLYSEALRLERRMTQKKWSTAYIFIVILLGLLNPFRTQQSQLALFFLVPSIAYVIKTKSNFESEVIRC